MRDASDTRRRIDLPRMAQRSCETLGARRDAKHQGTERQTDPIRLADVSSRNESGRKWLALVHPVDSQQRHGTNAKERNTTTGAGVPRVSDGRVVDPPNAGGNAVAAKGFSTSNPRERQLAFTALLSVGGV